MVGISDYITLIINSQIFSFGLGIIGILLAIIFYLKGKKYIKPTYSIKSFNLINDFSGKLSKLEVFYSQKKIKNLTITRIAFWNDGNLIIRKEDIAPIDPIKVSVDDKYEIFEAEIIDGTTKEANNFELIRLDEKSIIITFDFLSHNDGAILKVIHSGKSSKDINLTGTVIGAGRPKELNARYFTRPMGILTRKFILMLGIIGIPLYLFLILTIENSYLKTICIIILILLIIFISQTYKSRDFPNKFLSFQEDI